jgi:hypothetical protein
MGMINLLLALVLTQDPVDSFEKLHRMVRPAEQEAPWTEIPWMTSLWQARERAAREGKPLLIWGAGGGGHPLSLC